jgi:hypothetical protein
MNLSQRPQRAGRQATVIDQDQIVAGIRVEFLKPRNIDDARMEPGLYNVPETTPINAVLVNN